MLYLPTLIEKAEEEEKETNEEEEEEDNRTASVLPVGLRALLLTGTSYMKHPMIVFI